MHQAASDHPASEFAAYTMLVAGALLAVQALAHLSFFAFLVAYWLPLLDSKIKVVDAYLIPVGLYLIVLGFIYARRGASKAVANTLFVSGLVTVMGSTFIPSVGTAGAVHAVLLLVESIASIFVGILRRTKAFAFLGTIFLAANAAVQLRELAASVHWSVYATLAGLLVIGSGILFERKREELLAKGREIADALAEWD